MFECPENLCAVVCLLASSAASLLSAISLKIAKSCGKKKPTCKSRTRKEV